MPRRYAYLHEAVAAVVRRKFPQLQVTSDCPEGDPTGWELDIKGGTKTEGIGCLNLDWSAPQRSEDTGDVFQCAGRRRNATTEGFRRSFKRPFIGDR